MNRSHRKLKVMQSDVNSHKATIIVGRFIAYVMFLIVSNIIIKQCQKDLIQRPIDIFINKNNYN